MLKVPKALKTLWDKKLKESGFDDIEYPSGRLYQPNLNTKSFRFKEELISYYSALEDFVNENEDSLPLHHLQVLRMHIEGHTNVYIQKELGYSKSGIRKILYPYRKIIIDRILKK